MYDFNVLRLYTRLVPWFLRTPVFMSWLGVLASVVSFVQGLLLAFVNQTTFDLLFNAQVVYLEHVLNETFDSTPDIYIENVFLPSLYLDNKIESQPADYFRQEAENDPIYMRNREEYESTNQYIVHVAASLSGDVILITSLINMYNLAGIPYTIVFDL